MNKKTYPLWLLEVPESQLSLFPEVNEERKNLRYWRDTFFERIKPRLEEGALLSPEQREECERLKVLIPSFVGVSFELSALMDVLKLAAEYGGTVSAERYGCWVNSDNQPTSRNAPALEFRFDDAENAEEFFFDVCEMEGELGADSSGLRHSAYWCDSDSYFARTMLGDKEGEDQCEQ
jgi:hypothetical protein